ncbi:MAG: type I methionyl aminopeptidase [Candidatus Schekmanbacteria bacterium]|nr:type I methionyl aminopeptidase [Candidatus Schekmanbacteria bacterium]
MIPLKNKLEVDKLRNSCKIAAETLMLLKGLVKPGITTYELNKAAEQFILAQNAKPSFKGYMGFPSALCTSVNDEVVHGIPSNRQLKEGDIVSLDVGTWQDGFYGDMAITLPVGDIKPEVKKLLDVTQKALYLGIEQAKVGKRISDISWAIQSIAEKEGYSVVRAFVGHGIGRRLHEEPKIPNYGLPGRGEKIKAGMVLAIEPMINMGGSPVRILADQWTAVTGDGSLSAHFEHTVAITHDGNQILTKIE